MSPAAFDPSRKSRADTLLLVAVALMAALITYTVTTTVLHREQTLFGTQELEPFEAQYGPSHDTQFGEEWLVRDFFQDQRDGIFVDVGANHYRRHSMTYFLETQRGWTGVAIEAQASFAPEWAAHRPRTKFFAMFATDTVGESVRFYVPESRDGLNASGRPDLATVPTTETQVPSTTITAALEAAGIGRIDFLSMDIELYEPKALAGFDIDRFQPALACIEAHPVVRQQIMDYFDAHGYVIVGKYLRADVNNLYFTPRGQMRTRTGGSVPKTQ
jgi:FkbM family methyltransferase